MNAFLFACFLTQNWHLCCSIYNSFCTNIWYWSCRCTLTLSKTSALHSSFLSVLSWIFLLFFFKFCMWLKPWRSWITEEYPTSSVTESLNIRMEMLAIMLIVNLIVFSFLSTCNDQSSHIYNTHFDLLPWCSWWWWRSLLLPFHVKRLILYLRLFFMQFHFDFIPKYSVLMLIF